MHARYFVLPKHQQEAEPITSRHLFQVRHEQYDPNTLLHIRWNHEKYTIDFEGKVLGQIKLRDLKEICKDLTGVPLGGLSLTFGDATMKDDNAPLSCWGVKPGSKVVVHGIKPTVKYSWYKQQLQIEIHIFEEVVEQIKEMTTNGDPEEYALILRISGSLQKSKDFVVEHLPKYVEESAAYHASKPAPFSMQAMPPPRKKLHDLHGMMSENLLQSLLALDGVTCKPEFEVARVKRREAVKETQKLLDVIDAINVRVKESDNAARL
ncbi:hypothetical protein BGZ58_002354 [Dissophora ornata]|nr:hypothetical protein BGZ58_002354 [Dissophora ornata]